jgi:hypothetical protein
MDPKSRERDTLTAEFWQPILAGTDFKEYIKKRFSIVTEAIDDRTVEGE